MVAGDVINRSPFRHANLGRYSLETNAYLHRLSIQARAAGGDVRVIAGNTEVRILQRNKENLESYLQQGAAYERLRAGLLSQIGIGQLVAALSFGGLLMTHAITSSEHAKANERLWDFVLRANEILTKAAETDDFSDPIFQTPRGIMWLDINKASRPAFDQVHGHNERPDGRIGFELGGTTVNIDVGFTRWRLGYAVLQGSILKAYSLEPPESHRRPLDQATEASA